ncbi:MAG TPA: ABC transporter substrate-binding protein [Solirubrobacteraceae bacterium]|jgi:putative hydroxymethylpyrimidine transport system substrate-binding protein|nr:ABC transporter substrate-binding protein [Solirubrobacteraceae bacterium]
MSTRPEPRRRGAISAACLIAAVLCAGCGSYHARTALGPARSVTVAVGSAASAPYAPLYAAQANGDFTRGALRVRIEQPSGANPLAALLSGTATLAVVSEPALLQARDGGAKLVAIGALVGQPLDGIVTLTATAHQASATSSLSGRTVAVGSGALGKAELTTALATMHVAASKVHTVALHGSAAAFLSSRRSTATIGFSWPIIAATLARSGHSASVVAVEKAGVPTYSQLVVVARVSEAHVDGRLLRAFLQSLTRGERAVAANPAGAAATLAKANPAIGAGIERAALTRMLPSIAPPRASQPYGFQNAYAWQAFGDWMHSHGLLRQSADTGLAITDEFLPGQGEQIQTGA